MAERPSLPAQLPAAPRQGPYPIAVTVAVVMLGLDQLSKFMVVHMLALPQHRVIELLPFFALRWEENPGVSMNFLRASDDTGRWLLIGFTGMICAGVGVWFWREKRRDLAIALGLVLGGALGNIIDRINHGFVVDFADLHFGESRPFLIFNVADTAISIGVILLLGMSLLSKKPKRS
jgi:signal peptidase II